MAAPTRNSNIFINISPTEVPKTKKYCWFVKHNIKYVDYKDPDFLLRFVDDEGRIKPRRYTGTSSKYQKKVSRSIKRARFLALLPFVAESLK